MANQKDFKVGTNFFVGTWRIVGVEKMYRGSWVEVVEYNPESRYLWMFNDSNFLLTHSQDPMVRQLRTLYYFNPQAMTLKMDGFMVNADGEPYDIESKCYKVETYSDSEVFLSEVDDDHQPLGYSLQLERATKDDIKQ